MKHRLLITIMLLAQSLLASAAVNITFTSSGQNHVSYTYDTNTGEYSITTTGSDPYLYSTGLARALESGETFLTFEYKNTVTLTNMQIYFGNTFSEARSRIYGNLTNTNGEWQTAQFDLSSEIQRFSWGKAGEKLRMDFGFSSGVKIQLRNIRIMKKNDVSDNYKTDLSTHLEAYLKRPASTTCAIDQVETTSTLRLSVKGHTDGAGQYKLVEIPIYQDITELTKFEFEQELTEGDFDITLTRVVLRNGYRYDRMLSRWAIVDVATGQPVMVTHGHYADKVYGSNHPKAMPLLGKKGLGGFFLSPNADDLDELGIKSVTVNIVISTLITLNSSNFSNRTPFTYNSRTYYIDQNAINNLDATLLRCYKRGIVTNAILLVSPTACTSDMKRLLVHPECTGGYYSMPNLTTSESVQAYAAIITFLANRYSKTQYGRINNWILHNEVDYGLTWTNMGQQPVRNYVDTYVKSMRLVSLIAHQYDPEAWVLASFTHSWNSVGSDGPGYSTLGMTKLIQQFSAAEGDFMWGMACHPYPQDLTKPQFWKNDTQSTYAQTTPYITFKNLEILSNWAMNEQNFYNGQKRLVLLSENGTNSPSYSANDLSLQAAGACWAWKKANILPGIDAIQWHNWQDNREEFGLRIGLRRYMDDAQEPNGCKPVWYVWKAAGTEDEDEVFDPYLSVLGYANWDKIFVPGILTGIEAPHESTTLPTENEETRIYDVQGRYLGQRLESLPHGLYIVRQGNKARKVMH